MISYACVVNNNEHFFSNQKVSRILVFSFFFDGEIICSLFFTFIILFLHLLAVCVQVCTYVPDPANIQKSETTWRSWFSSTTMWVLEMVISLPSWQSACVSCKKHWVQSPVFYKLIVLTNSYNLSTQEVEVINSRASSNLKVILSIYWVWGQPGILKYTGGARLVPVLS